MVSNSANTSSDEKYTPVFFASSRETKPRAMNSCCVRLNATLRRSESSTKAESYSPGRNISSAAWRSSGCTRRAGMVAVLGFIRSPTASPVRLLVKLHPSVFREIARQYPFETKILKFHPALRYAGGFFQPLLPVHLPEAHLLVRSEHQNAILLQEATLFPCLFG